MKSLDILIIFLSLVFSFAIPFFLNRKNSQKTLSDHYQSSGNLNWFVAGTAMVATTFAADTPLAVTEIVNKNGISGNWLWWYGSIGSIITVYLFAPLWKRSGALTDVELVKLRYSGKESDYLRMFKAVYLGLFANVLILAWVNLAMKKISEVLIPEYSAFYIVSGLILFGFLYTSILGLTGISYSDTFQFFFAMSGCILLAILGLNLSEVGGISGLKQKLSNEQFQFIPDFYSGAKNSLSLKAFLTFVLVSWWASWYPGAEPGGGGYIAQRIMAAKDVRSSILASLWFTIAHYFIRPWPWIIVGLISIVLFPELSMADKGKGYVLLITKFDYAGLVGFMVAGFIAAYLSTVATHLNWGSSYLVNDLYKPYLDKNKSEEQYLKVGKYIQFITIILSIIITFYFIETISGVWEFLLESGAGVGFVLTLRWFVPRLNAYSEIGAFLFPPIFYLIAKFALNLEFPESTIFIVSSVIGSVIVLTYSTKVTDFDTLKSFYLRVKPPGLFWKTWALSNQVPIFETNYTISKILVLSGLGLVMLFSGLFGLGYLIFGDMKNFTISISLLVLTIYLTYKYFPQKLD